MKPMDRRKVERVIDALPDGGVVYFGFIDGWGNRATLAVRREGNVYVTWATGRGWWDAEIPMTREETIEHLLANQVFE